MASIPTDNNYSNSCGSTNDVFYKITIGHTATSDFVIEVEGWPCPKCRGYMNEDFYCKKCRRRWTKKMVEKGLARPELTNAQRRRLSK